METKDKVLLPEGFEEIKLSSVNFKNRLDILEYCSSCMKNPICETNRTLKYCMSGNIPYWSKRFLAVEIPTPHRLVHSFDIRVFCVDYESPQLKIPRIITGFSDGVQQLLEIAEREKAEYIEMHGNSLDKQFYRVMCDG